jgi:hypothetical protein
VFWVWADNVLCFQHGSLDAYLLNTRHETLGARGLSLRLAVRGALNTFQQQALSASQSPSSSEHKQQQQLDNIEARAAAQLRAEQQQKLLEYRKWLADTNPKRAQKNARVRERRKEKRREKAEAGRVQAEERKVAETVVRKEKAKAKTVEVIGKAAMADGASTLVEESTVETTISSNATTL